MNLDQFTDKYLELLTGEYAGINLTRITNAQEFKDKQIIDSLAPLEQSDVFNGSIGASNVHLDVGFGGGFPLLPLANVLRGTKFVGIETRGKKCKVVGEIAQKLGLNNVAFIHSRIEDVLIDVDATVSFKAVGKVNDFLSKLNFTKDLKVFFYKGPGFYEQEKDQLDIVKNKWDIIEEKEIDVPGVDKRLIIGFAPKNVLRGTKKFSKQLVKVSSII
jgi:16S rRNA (guanine527-N7)-methyltransferase